MRNTAFCFDLDGTLTKEEILPIIAKEINIFEEINLLTKLTLEGTIPFVNSFKLRVKLLATVPVEDVVNIISNVKLDSELREFVRENKSDCYIVTGNLDVWIDDLIKTQYGCKYFSSKALLNDGKLKGVDSILNKGEAIDELRKTYQKIVTIGDSMNDCSMAEKADVSIAYGGVHDPVESLLKISDYLTYSSNSLVNLLQNLKSNG